MGQATMPSRTRLAAVAHTTTSALAQMGSILLPANTIDAASREIVPLPMSFEWRAPLTSGWRNRTAPSARPPEGPGEVTNRALYPWRPGRDVYDREKR